MNPPNIQIDDDSIDLYSNENINYNNNNNNKINNNNNTEENKIDLSISNNEIQNLDEKIINNNNKNTNDENNNIETINAEDNNNNNNESNNQFEDEEEQKENPIMILTIEVGNGKIEQLKLFNLDNPSKDVYEFCVKNKLDFYVMEEINK